MNVFPFTWPTATWSSDVLSRYLAYTTRQIDQIPQIAPLDPEWRTVMKAVAAVFPFRVNTYVLDHLIDWEAVPHDPIFQLVFPQREMLDPDDLALMLPLIKDNAPLDTIEAMARSIRMRLNPHPAGQLDQNVPHLHGRPLPGLQHKYPETVLFFPPQGQTCHSYCTYCFRWPQFIGDRHLKIAADDVVTLVNYLRHHPEVTDVLITGGDPLIMKTRLLETYLEPLLNPALATLQDIRIGTKALAYWPQRFVTDDDADDLLRLFERVVRSGRQLALMVHYTHPRELEPAIAQEAIRRVRATGAVLRSQAPLVRHINDEPAVWATLWRTQVRLGIIPYYMFVERDTGPKHYFEVPLVRAAAIFREAYASVSGLARTVRGPSMSTNVGKVMIDGVAEVGGERVFVLHLLQARNPAWVQRPFFAQYHPTATWWSELRPACGERYFFFECDEGCRAGG